VELGSHGCVPEGPEQFFPFLALLHLFAYMHEHLPFLPQLSIEELQELVLRLYEERSSLLIRLGLDEVPHRTESDIMADLRARVISLTEENRQLKERVAIVETRIEALAEARVRPSTNAEKSSTVLQKTPKVAVVPGTPVTVFFDWEI